jgi:hypothetical protein
LKEQTKKNFLSPGDHAIATGNQMNFTQNHAIAPGDEKKFQTIWAKDNKN